MNKHGCVPIKLYLWAPKFKKKKKKGYNRSSLFSAWYIFILPFKFRKLAFHIFFSIDFVNTTTIFKKLIIRLKGQVSSWGLFLTGD